MNNLDNNHNVLMENREKLNVTGVTHVEEFDENIINLHTTKGNLIIKGEKLHIEKLNLESSELSITGVIYNFEYLDAYNKGSIWSKLFK